ncbi:MAG: C69 family dipeptidase, partial [Chloroflexi bacterium]|nr:C69 family dipeptidase [Chloroflexota bacterium]
MCDTLVALGNATRDGSVIFAKNSDREPNEAHLLEWHPRAQHPAGSTVRCTYIEIPQVEETYEILLCKPFWLWGCEMGANEKGVVIGNEAVFTREPHAPTGLLGMDLMRLALERAATADEALRVITDLIAQYGQGGACGYQNKRLRYHNSFIIADAQSAWVLETAGRYWAAERVRDVRTISNRLTIGREYDLASPGLVEHALERGWCR